MRQCIHHDDHSRCLREAVSPFNYCAEHRRTDETRCHFINPEGLPCSKQALVDKDYCLDHSAESEMTTFRQCAYEDLVGDFQCPNPAVQYSMFCAGHTKQGMVRRRCQFVGPNNKQCFFEANETGFYCEDHADGKVKEASTRPDEYLLKQGDVRIWRPSTSIHVKVRICGVASNGQPVLGVGYIGELLDPIPGYDFTHVMAFEVHLS